MEKQYDMEKIRKVLEGFRVLPYRRWFQDSGRLWANSQTNELEEECGGCVGAWCAYFLEVPSFKFIGNQVTDKVSHWYYGDGQHALADLLHLNTYTLNRLLIKHGADSCPFGADPWPSTPYSVLRKTVLEVTGYDHNEYLQGLPVPPKGLEAHEALAGMP